MDNKTTNTSNDESRKETKTTYVSDEEVRKDIENWDEGKGIIIAAIDWEAIIEKEAAETSSANSSSSGIRKRRIKVGSKVSKGLNALIVDPLVTVGAKEEKGKFKKARENAKQIKKRQESKREEQEKE